MDTVIGFIALIYWVGAFVALIVYPHRIGGNRYAYVTVFMHHPSRRNGIPWLAKTIVKIFGWPVVLALWLRDDRPPSKELYGEAAAERLGIPPESLNEATNAFATKWTA